MGGGGRGEEDLGEVLDLGLVLGYLWRVRPECSCSQERLCREDLSFLRADVFRSDILPLPSGKSRDLDTDYHSGSDLDILKSTVFISHRTIKFTITSHCGSKVSH